MPVPVLRLLRTTPCCWCYWLPSGPRQATESLREGPLSLGAEKVVVSKDACHFLDWCKPPAIPALLAALMGVSTFSSPVVGPLNWVRSGLCTQENMCISDDWVMYTIHSGT